jgi:hypothetical protein
MYSVYDTLAGGLPHSDIHGSTPARGSPWLFAACHVLHRLLVPRHPPNALLILDIPDVLPQKNASPCTETILRMQCPQRIPASNIEDRPGNTLHSAPFVTNQPDKPDGHAHEEHAHSTFSNGHFPTLLAQPGKRSIRQNRSQRL